nr:uncharacterized mitochondrial protein AtMg00810-like [Tanacetum cinerariifolium]
MDTPMVEKSKLDEDKEGKAINSSHYRGMIGTLLYLTASIPDLQFAICMCAQYQARPTEKHVHTVKRIFRYLRGTVNRGLWYPKDSSIALTAFADADHTGCQDTRRSTSGSLQFLGDRLISYVLLMAWMGLDANIKDDVSGKAKTTSTPTSPTHKLKLHMYLNLFHTRSMKQRLSLLGKKVEAMPKSAWTAKDQIDNFLKERRLMRSLEKFVGGRLYEGDFRLLQRTI